MTVLGERDFPQSASLVLKGPSLMAVHQDR